MISFKTQHTHIHTHNYIRISDMHSSCLMYNSFLDIQMRNVVEYVTIEQHEMFQIMKNAL